MSKRRSEDENAAPAKRGGAGYIGRRKEHRFEDVGDANLPVSVDVHEAELLVKLECFPIRELLLELSAQAREALRREARARVCHVDPYAHAAAGATIVSGLASQPHKPSLGQPGRVREQVEQDLVEPSN